MRARPAVDVPGAAGRPAAEGSAGLTAAAAAHAAIEPRAAIGKTLLTVAR